MILKGLATLSRLRDLVFELPQKRSNKPQHFLRLSRKTHRSLKKRSGVRPKPKPRLVHVVKRRPM